MKNSPSLKTKTPLRTLLAFLTVLFLGAAVLPLTGCEKKGPLEEIGEELDDAVDDIGDAIEDGTDG